MLYVQVIVEEVLIELVHTESACSTSILGIVAAVRGCGMYVRCACYFIFSQLYKRTHTAPPTHRRAYFTENAAL